MGSIADIGVSGIGFDNRYRTIAEASIVEALALAGHAGAPHDPEALTKVRDALDHWIDLGLTSVVSPKGTRLFDPVEVWTAMKRAGREGRDRWYLDRYVVTGRSLVEILARSAAPQGPFAIEMRRTFPPSDDRQSRRLRLPLPLTAVHAHRSIDILDDRDAVVIYPERIERRSIPSKPSTLAAQITVSAPTPGRIAIGHREIYLRPREGFVVVSHRIHELASRLARLGSTIDQQVKAFWRFLIERFTCVPIHYDQVYPDAPCDWVLDTGSYDCRLGAALFVALCRARSIPARIVGGHVLYRSAPTNHFWAEYLGSNGDWTPVDFLGWDLSIAGADAIWRDHFFGHVDARLVTEILPRSFAGPSGVAIPSAWHLLQTAVNDGVAITLTALDGRLIYTDHVRLIGPA